MCLTNEHEHNYNSYNLAQYSRHRVGSRGIASTKKTFTLSKNVKTQIHNTSQRKSTNMKNELFKHWYSYLLPNGTKVPITPIPPRKYKLRPFRPLMTEKEFRLLHNLAGVSDKALRQSNLTYVIYGGTLIGSYRHYDIIPWDDDVDVLSDVLQTDQLLKVLGNISDNYKVVKGNTKSLKFSHATKSL